MSRKILSVDDSKMVHMVVGRALKPLGFEIVAAPNGAEGLQKAEAEKPELILLDITMPVMDGIETLMQLKGNAATREIPVIMLTADGGKDSEAKARNLGALDFVSKPFTPEALVTALSRHIPVAAPAPA